MILGEGKCKNCHLAFAWHDACAIVAGNMNGGRLQMILGVMTGLFVVTTILLIGLITSGYVKVVWSPNKSTVVTANICTIKQINKHNELLSKGAVSKEEYKPLYEEVTGLSGYENDATCVYLAAQYGLILKDKNIMAKEVTRLEQLVNEGQGISPYISPVISLEVMKTISQRLDAGASPSEGE